jgi:hypothetical protein
MSRAEAREKDAVARREMIDTNFMLVLIELSDSIA